MSNGSYNGLGTGLTTGLFVGDGPPMVRPRQQLGLIHNERFSNFSGWDVTNANGGSFVCNGNGTMTMSSGIGDFNRRIFLNLYQNVFEKWMIETDFTVTTTGVGPGISFQQNPYVSTNASIIARVSTTVGVVQSVICTAVDGSGTIGSRTSGTALAYSGTDLIRCQLIRMGETYIIRLFNLTQGTQSPDHTYVIGQEATVNRTNRNGNFGLHELGGTTVHYTFKVYSLENKNCQAIWIGDSNSCGYGLYPNAETLRIPTKVFANSSKYCAVVSGSGHATSSVLAEYDSYKLLNGKYAIISLMQNDLRAAVAQATYRANFTSLINGIVAYGGIPVILSMYPSVDVDPVTENAWLKSNFSQFQYVNVYDTLLGSGHALQASYAQADGIHLTDAGTTAAANKIKRDLSYML